MDLLKDTKKEESSEENSDNSHDNAVTNIVVENPHEQADQTNGYHDATHEKNPNYESEGTDKSEENAEPDQNNPNLQHIENNESKTEDNSEMFNKNEMINMFEKMAKESIQKITQGDNSDSSDESLSHASSIDVDRILNSDPQQLIIANKAIESEKENDNWDSSDNLEKSETIENENNLESLSNGNAGEETASKEIANHLDEFIKPSEPVAKPDANDDILKQLREKVQRNTESKQKNSSKKTTHDDLINKLQNKIKSSEKSSEENDRINFNEKILDEEDENRRNYLNELKNLLSSKAALKKQQIEDEDEDNNEAEYDDENNNKNNEDDEQQEEEKVEPPPKKTKAKSPSPFTIISNDTLSYERFYPGRILGNTFSIHNRWEETVDIRVSFTKEYCTKEFVTEKLMQFYEVAKPEDIDYPYSKYIHQEYIDADKEFDCWFIEDPVKKTLVKKVEYTLNPLETYEFIIVLKSPIIKKTHFLITNVIVEDLESNYFHKIFAFGSLDIPKLWCPKEIIWHVNSNQQKLNNREIGNKMLKNDSNYSCVNIVMHK